MTTAEEGSVWHRESVSDTVERVMSDLSPVVVSFYLAGGTALALQLGHWHSQDLDLFTFEAFDPETFIHRLQSLPEFGVIAKTEGTLHCTLRGIKVSFFVCPYPLLFPLASLEPVKVAEVRDIACMKISAIAGRATRRDFIDLYFAARDSSLAKLLDLFQMKFAQANYSLPHILKSLTYFEEAEQDPMPDMLRPAEWSEIKSFFQTEVPGLLRMPTTHS